MSQAPVEQPTEEQRRVTAFLPADIARRLKIEAAERDTTISALVGELVMQRYGKDAQ